MAEHDVTGILAFADAALALGGHEVTDPVLRGLVESAARHELTGDQAIAAMRRYVQEGELPCREAMT